MQHSRQLWLQLLVARRTVTTSAATSTATSAADVAIVGGGIVGVATARELQRRWPRLRCLLLEKEPRLAQHQTGRNSGVIHAGIYYKPGSLKAALCVSGMQKLYNYCDASGVAYKRCGKLVVATNAVEVARLRQFYQRGLSNQVPGLRLLQSQVEIKEIEPHCCGIEAVHSPNTGIIDYGDVTQQLAADFINSNGKVQCDFQLSRVAVHSAADYDNHATAQQPLLHLQSANGESAFCRHLVTCAGLQSDRVAALTLQLADGTQQQQQQQPAIVPFRGDYLVLRSHKRHLVQGNIYPVPDPSLPFLGVHFTPRMDGSVWLGPNAVLSLKREGYGRFDADLRDAVDAVGSGGLWRLLLRNVRPGMRELRRVFSLAATVRDLQKFVPSLTVDDVVRGPSGVRAQALDSGGNLVDDFVIDSSVPNVMHLLNAPSPAATSSLAIAEFIADKAAEHFALAN